MKYLSKSEEVVSSFDQIKLRGVSDNILSLDDNRHCIVLKCSTINLELMSLEQQTAILSIYEDFLNSLDGSCQILVQIRGRKADNLGSDGLEEEDGGSSNDLIRTKLVMSRNFYLIIKHEQTETNSTAADWHLKLRAQIAQQNLHKLGVKAKILENLEIIRLLRGSLNPLNSQNGDITGRQALGRTDLLKTVSYDDLVEATDHLRINGIYTQVLAIRNYPLAADSDCLAELINFDADIDISYHIEPANTLFALEQLNRKIAELESQKRSQLKSGRLLTPQITDPLDSALSLRAKLARNQETLYQLSIYIAVFAGTREEMESNAKRLKNVLAGRLFATEVMKYQQLPAWEACQSIATNGPPEAKRNFDTSSLALTFPFRSLEMIDENGILYGLNKANNSLVMVDRFSLPNANSVIFAQSGAGKSYTMKLEILRLIKKGVRVIVIDPENEYKAVCQALAGNFLQISKDSSQTLNPLQIETSEDESSHKHLKEKLPAIMQILELMAEGLDADQRAALDQALLKTYKQKPQPLLADLQQILKRQKQTSLCTRLEKFVSGSLSDIFAFPTNIDLNSRLTVFNIQHVDESLRPLVMMIIANFVNSQVFDKPEKRLLVIDEAWLLLQHRAAKDFLNALIRRARKYYLGVALISQQVADFYQGKQASALIAQTSLRILLRQDSTQIRAIAEQLALSEYEQKFLLTAAVGEALIIADNQHVVANILATSSEHPLITTNPSELYNN